MQVVGQHRQADPGHGDRHRGARQGEKFTPGEVFGHLSRLVGIKQLSEAAVPGGAQQANQHRRHRQHRQGHGHLPARFMGVVGVVAVALLMTLTASLAGGAQQLGLQGLVVAAEAALEGEEVEAEHVESGHSGGDEASRPEHWIGVEGLAQDLVLTPEASQRWDAGDRHAADQEGDCCDRHVLAQAAHQTHVLGEGRFVAHHLLHGVDHRARAKKEHRLEEGVGHQVEHARHRGAAAHGQHHVTQLTHGAVGQALLEVLLGEGDRGAQKQGDRANDRDHQLYGRKGCVDGLEAGHQEHACGHHRGRVNQGRDRRGALHGVGQPHMQRELGRFRHWPHEHQQAEQHGHTIAEAAAGHGCAEARADLLEAEAAGGPEQAEDAQKEPEVADAVHHKRLLGGIGGTVAVVPEANQQVGAHPHQLPEHVDLQQVGADDQPQHRTAEQGQIGEEAHIALVMGHVAIGVHHHQKGDGGDQGQHHRPKGIHPVAHLQVEVAGAGPVEQHLPRAGPGQLLGKHRVAEHGRDAHAGE